MLQEITQANADGSYEDGGDGLEELLDGWHFR